MHILKQQLQHAPPLASVAHPQNQPCLTGFRPFTNNQLLLHPPNLPHSNSASQTHHGSGFAGSTNTTTTTTATTTTPTTAAISGTTSSTQFVQFSSNDFQFSARQNQIPFHSIFQNQHFANAQDSQNPSCPRFSDAVSFCNSSSSSSSSQTLRPVVARNLAKCDIANPRAAFVDGLVDITASIINAVWPNQSFSSKARLLPIQRFVQEILRRSRTSFSTLQLALLYLLRIKNELNARGNQLDGEASLSYAGAIESNGSEQFASKCNTSAPSFLNVCLSPVSPAVTDESGLRNASQVIAPSTVVSSSDSSAVQVGYTNAVNGITANGTVHGRNHPSHCGRRMFLAALVVAGKYLQDQTYSNRAWSKISGLTVEEVNQNEREFLKVIDYRLHVNNETFISWSHMLMTWANVNKIRRERAAAAGMAHSTPFSAAAPCPHDHQLSASASPSPSTCIAGSRKEDPSESFQRNSKRQRNSAEMETGLLSPENSSGNDSDDSSTTCNGNGNNSDIVERIRRAMMTNEIKANKMTRLQELQRSEMRNYGYQYLPSPSTESGDPLQQFNISVTSGAAASRCAQGASGLIESSSINAILNALHRIQNLASASATSGPTSGATAANAAMPERKRKRDHEQRVDEEDRMKAVGQECLIRLISRLNVCSDARKQATAAATMSDSGVDVASWVSAVQAAGCGDVDSMSASSFETN